MLLSIFYFMRISFKFLLPRNALLCKARSCYRMSSVRLSVCPSVTLVDLDHIGSKSWKLIARTINPTSSFFVAQRSSTLLSGKHGEILGRLELGWEKVACWSTKAEISLKHVKIEERLLWRAYRKSRMLFQMVPSATPLRPPLPLN